jgi:hypothetical protein
VSTIPYPGTNDCVALAQGRTVLRTIGPTVGRLRCLDNLLRNGPGDAFPLPTLTGDAIAYVTSDFWVLFLVYVSWLML